MHKYKSLTPAELREIQSISKNYPDYQRQVIHKLLSHIAHEREVISELRLENERLMNPSILESPPNARGSSLTSPVPGPVGSKVIPALVDNKGLFQAYKGSLKPNSIEEERVKRWSKPKVEMKENPLDSNCESTHNKSYEE